MKVIEFCGRRPVPQSMAIGSQYDNKAEQVRFLLPTYEGGTATLHLRLGDYADIVDLPESGIWMVTNKHTQYAGKFAAYVTILAAGETVWRSEEFYLSVRWVQDDGPLIEQAYPTAIEETLQAAKDVRADRVIVEQARAVVEEAMETVEGAAAAEAARQTAETARALAEANRAAAFSGWQTELDGKAVVDDGSIGGDAWSSKGLIDRLCPPLAVAGGAVRCAPMAGYPLDVTVSWEPAQGGTGVPAPDNVRPISARNNVQVAQCGRNLLKGTKTLEKNEEVASLVGVVSGTALFEGCSTLNTNKAWQGYKINFSKVAQRMGIKAGDTVTYSIWAHAEGTAIQNVRYGFWTTPSIAGISGKRPWSFTPQEAKAWRQLSYTFTVTPEFLAVTSLRIESDYYETEDYMQEQAKIVFAAPQLEVGSSATAHEAWRGASYALTLPEPIVGGRVDVTGGQSEKTWAAVQLTGEESLAPSEASVAGEGNHRYSLALEYAAAEQPGALCSHYACAGTGDMPLNSFRIEDDALTLCTPHATAADLAAFLAAQQDAGTPVTFCYRLAAPASLSTAPTAILALEGENSLGSGAGMLTVRGREAPTSVFSKLEEWAGNMARRITALEASVS